MIQRCSLAVLALLIAGCSRTPPDWNGFASRYLDEYFNAHPEMGVYAGRHEFDGKLSDFSREGMQREVARLHTARDRAAAFRDSDLTARQRFERQYVLAQIDGELFWREKARWPFRNPAFYTASNSVNPIEGNVYLTRPYAPIEKRMAAFIAYERALPQAVQQIQSIMERPMPKSWIEIGHIGFGGMADYFEHDVPAIFASVKDDRLQGDFRAANTAVVNALRSFDGWLAGLRATATDNFAMGEQLFSGMLRETERVELPLAQVEAAGKRDLERNLAALKKACESYAPGADLTACVGKQAAHKPAGDLLDVARGQLTELKAFIVAKNLVSIPSDENALVAEAPPYARWNFAYMDPVGPYEKGLPSVYYLSPPDPKWPAAEQQAYVPGVTSLLFTSAHEIWPGHFLHFLHANRTSFEFGRVFEGYGFTEGWAHYTEEMMWEAGLGDNSPEVHIGQLTQALLRNVRFLSAIGMHSGRMTVADSERMFRESAFADPGTARQQAARGTFDPAYLNYTLGKLMIRKLREDWTAAKGGRAAWREFHDRFLDYGGPPVPLVRTELLGPNAGAAL